MKRHCDIVIASIYKELLHKKRYLFNTIISMVLFYVIFFFLWGGYSIFLNKNSLSPINLGSSISSVIISYYAWTMILSVYTFTAYIVQMNRQYGTIENLIINAGNFSFLLISENLVSILFYFIFSWINILIFSLISGISFYINFFTVLYIIIIGLLSILGLSFVIAGFSLLFRQTDSITSIFQFILLGILFIPDSLISRLLLPFYQANRLLQKSFIQNISLESFGVYDHLFLIFNTVLYLSIGLIFFNKCLNKAKSKGTLSFY